MAAWVVTMAAMMLSSVLVIALVVAAEKLLPRGQRTAWVTGGALLALGALIAVRPQLALGLRGQGM